MLIVVIVVVAAALLVYGVLTNGQTEIIAAGILSLIALIALFGGRFLRTRPTPDDAPGSGGGRADADADADDHAATDDPPVPDQSTDQPHSDITDETDDVVFLVGRTTFHRPVCAAIAGRAVSTGERDKLEAGGMTACRRCLGS